MTPSGDFVLRDNSGVIFWRTNTAWPVGAHIELQNNGRLIIRANYGNQILWQTDKLGSC